MADVLAPLDVLDTQILEALGELRGARSDFEHCPSADNKVTVEYAELRLNRLLDRRPATRQGSQA